MNDVARTSDAKLHQINGPDTYRELEEENERLRRQIEEVCKQRATSPITRARLRHVVAGVDWRKAK
jgi:hypothetical protein